MAKITTLEELKAIISPLTIYGDYVQLTGSGRRRTALCPFHKEKTPSFSVDTEGGLFYCFGCHKGGDIIKFIEEIEKCSFEEAVLILAKKGGVEFSFYKSERSSEEGKRRGRLLEILSMSLSYFRNALINSPTESLVKRYIKERGIPNEAITQLLLGYSEGKGELLSLLLRNGFRKEECVLAGVVREGKGGEYWEYFHNRLIFPIFDLQERVVGFGGRSLSQEEPKYLNSPETSLFRKRELLFGLNFSKEAIRREGKAILVEGYMDFLTLYSNGIKNCVASLGTSLTQSQASLIKRYCDNVVLIYDSDESGMRATERAIPILSGSGLNVKVAIFPEVKDPDEAIKKLGIEFFKKRIEESHSIVDFIIYQFSSSSFTKVEEKVRFLERAALAIGEIKDPIKREGYLNELSTRTGISSKAIMERIESLQRIERDCPFEKEQGIDITLNEIIIIKNLLSLNYESIMLISTIPEKILSTLKTYPIIEKLLKGEEVVKEEELKVIAFVNTSFHEGISYKDLLGAVTTIKKEFYEKRRKELTAKMKDAELKGDKDLVDILLREISALSKEALEIKSGDFKYEGDRCGG